MGTQPDWSSTSLLPAAQMSLQSGAVSVAPAPVGSDAVNLDLTAPEHAELEVDGVRRGQAGRRLSPPLLWGSQEGGVLHRQLRPAGWCPLSSFPPSHLSVTLRVGWKQYRPGLADRSCSLRHLELTTEQAVTVSSLRPSSRC